MMTVIFGKRNYVINDLILFFVNCERTVLFSVKRDLDPPLYHPHIWMSRYRARSIQPKFPEISVQNSMDRFGPTGKVLKKRVHLLSWSSFHGRTGWKFG